MSPLMQEKTNCFICITLFFQWRLPVEKENNQKHSVQLQFETLLFYRCGCSSNCSLSWSCCFLILSSWLPTETGQKRFLVCEFVPGDILPEGLIVFLDIFQNLSEIVFCVTASLSGDQSRCAVRVHNQSKCFWGQQFACVRILLEIRLMDWVQCYLWDRWEKQVKICWTSVLGSDRIHVIWIAKSGYKKWI